MPSYETFVFNPKTMRRSKAHPDVIYDSTRILDRSFKNELGGIVIGTKGQPTRQEINDTLMHELCHSKDYLRRSSSRLDDAQEELRAYNRERERSSPRRWSRILPTRITDFGASVSWLSKKQKAETKPNAMKILSPKTGGGNMDVIEQAHKKLDKDWGPELEAKPEDRGGIQMNKNDGKMQSVYHGTTEANAKKILKNGFKPDTFFATHLEHALGYGGNYIFEVAVPSAAIPKTPDWEFEGTPTIPKSQRSAQYWEFTSGDDAIPPSQIVEVKQYPKAKTVTKNQPLRTEVFNPKTKAAKDRLQIVYHGTDEATAKKILKTGFKPGTFFAIHLEDSIGFGGNYIFEVAVKSASLPKPNEKLGTNWEFIATDRVPPSQIVELKHYPKAKLIMENKALGEAVFRSNLPKPKPQPDIRVVSSGPNLHTSRLNTQPRISRMPTKQPKISRGVYADTKGQRISRRPHRHWKRIY